MFSFVGNKKNKQWVWIAMDVRSRQIIAFYVGDRSRESASELWKSVPESYRKNATFYADNWQAYKGVIPAKQHRVVKERRRKSNHLERFNCTLRQRVSRLVRKALSFSKKLSNHIAPSSISSATAISREHYMYSSTQSRTVSNRCVAK